MANLTNTPITSPTDRIVNHIRLQFPRKSEHPFRIDETVARSARQIFHKNSWTNQIISKIGVLSGLISVIGFVGTSIIALYSRRYIWTALAISCISSLFFFTFRNRGGYILQSALVLKNEAEQIQRLSLGASLNQMIYPFGGAAPGFMAMVDGGARTLYKHLAEQGQYKTLAYTLMLEESQETRSRLAMEAIPFSADVETAQMLVDIGAKIVNVDSHRLFSFCCLSCETQEDLKLVNFFVKQGGKIDAGIKNYQKWQSDLEDREHRFGSDWFSPNKDGVSPTLHPDFRTPLEYVVVSSFSCRPNLLTENPSLVFKAFQINSSAYTNKETPEALFHALNQSGARIRLKYAKEVFKKLSM